MQYGNNLTRDTKRLEMETLEIMETKWRDGGASWGLAALYHVKNKPRDIRVRLFRIAPSKHCQDSETQIYMDNYAFFGMLPAGEVRSQAFNVIDPMW